MTSPVSLLSLATGSVRPFRGVDEPSAIAKHAVAGRVRVGRLGLAGDAQADRVHHGGADKALHHYPRDHYAFWQRTIGEHPLLSHDAAFGENISTRGLTEEDMCIGDRWQMGSALVEVSHGRQPCWKLDHRFGGLRINATMVRQRCAGWYYRVIEEGEAEAGDTMVRIARPHPEWTVARVFGLLIAGDHKTDRESLEALGDVPELAEAWKERRAKLLGV